jgi:hypothetical protein
VSNNKEAGQFLVDFIKMVNDTSPTMFDELMSEDPELEKNDDKSVIFREQGNKLYQEKDFKVIKS